MENIISDKDLFDMIQSASEINDADGRDAFCTLYRKYYRSLTAFAMHILESREEAENTVQDVMMDLWKRRKSININISVSSFLYSAVKNKCITRKNHGQVDKKYISSLRLSMLEDGFLEYHDFYSHREIRIILQKTLDAMPEAQRTAFKLSRVEARSYNEIAEMTGVSEKTVEYRISQALRKLRLALADFMP